MADHKGDERHGPNAQCYAEHAAARRLTILTEGCYEERDELGPKCLGASGSFLSPLSFRLDGWVHILSFSIMLSTSTRFSSVDVPLFTTGNAPA